MKSKLKRAVPLGLAALLAAGMLWNLAAPSGSSGVSAAGVLGGSRPTAPATGAKTVSPGGGKNFGSTTGEGPSTF